MAIAELFKIGEDISLLQAKLKEKDSKEELQARVDELLKRRRELLADLEKQSRERLGIGQHQAGNRAAPSKAV